MQGGSSCVKAQRAEKFGRKLLALTYAILSRFIHFLEDFGQGKCSFGSKQRFFGKKFTITWYIMHIMTKTFVAIFALAENLLTSTTLLIFMSSFFHGQTSVKDTSEQISDLKMIGSYIFTCLYPMTSLSKLSDH